VDDADSNITYTGAWYEVASKSLDTLGNFGPNNTNLGPIYLGTTHGTNDTASFAYPFQGSSTHTSIFLV
jgi:hypothetical protein